MFGNWTVLTAKDEDGQTKAPPPPPTPLQFPSIKLEKSLDQARCTSQNISQLFTTIQKTGPKIDHLQALSVRSIEISFKQLVPEDFLPDVAWDQDPAVTGGSSTFPAPLPPEVTLSNGAPIPGHEAWYKSAKELLYDNEDVYRFLSGKPSSPARLRTRVAMFRKFWDGLQQMGMYWDSSSDKYEDVAGDTAPETAMMNQDQLLAQKQLKEEASPSQPSEAATSSQFDKEEAATKTTDTQISEGTKEENPSQRYTGNRIGAGRDMPARFREDVVSAFVETIAMEFHCRIERPRIDPKVKLQNILIPLPQTGIVYRCPKDRNQARRGILEGPLMAIQCTNQMIFCRPGETEGEGQGEVSNLLREVGLMLSLAQKRARAGQEEPEPSEEEWWATKPRWGGGGGGAVGAGGGGGGSGGSGGSGSEMQSIEGNSDEAEGSKKGPKRPKRSTAIENWKNLERAPSRWEKGITYLQIGKNPTLPHDDIYLISSLNHHLSILHLRIHPSFLQYLSNPPTWVSPSDEISSFTFSPSEEGILNVHRTRWFDLFRAEDRIEAMRATWGVFGWIMR